MFCFNKRGKAAIRWEEFDRADPGRSVSEGERKEIRNNVRRDLIDFQIPRVCDSYCKFTNLVKNGDALAQICEACPITRIVRYMEVYENGNE